MSLTNLRPELAQHLSHRLRAFSEGFRHNLAIIGPPGSGKTFQLEALMARPPAGVLIMYCPLYRESCQSLLRRLLTAIVGAGLPATTYSDVGSAQTPQPLEAMLAAAERELPATAAATQPISGLLVRRLYHEALTRTLDLVPVVSAERRQSCVLILDEFLYLEEMGLAHAFDELGKRVMTWPSTLFILSSSSPHRARAIVRERLQLLFGQFELVSLHGLDLATTMQWAQQELGSVRGVEVMHQFLIRWLGAYPWYLTVFLRRIKESDALGHRSETAEALLLQAAWDVLGAPEGTLHQWCASRTEALARLRWGARALDALLQIAVGTRTATEIGRRIGRAGVPQALQLLVEHDVAQRNGMCWMVTDPVLRCWLTTVLFAQRAGRRPIDASSARERFEHYLRDVWTRWHDAHRLSFDERVAELFGRFSDDTVSLDSRTGRLPKFERIRTETANDSSAGTYVVADGHGRRWCATVQDGAIDESAISGFESFCREQRPKPSRKVVITTSSMDETTRLLAKAAKMWVWEPDAVEMLMGLYGQF